MIAKDTTFRQNLASMLGGIVGPPRVQQANPLMAQTHSVRTTAANTIISGAGTVPISTQ
jgi:hypothetical protein